MAFQIDMFTKIGVGEPSSSKLAQNTVIAQLLTNSISHSSSSESRFPSIYSSPTRLLSIVVVYHIYMNDAVKKAHSAGEYTHTSTFLFHQTFKITYLDSLTRGYERL